MRNEVINMGLTEARTSLGKIVKKTYMDNSTIILEKGGFLLRRWLVFMI